MNRKHLSYSGVTALALTALAQLMYKQGGELVLWPGILVEVMVNGLMLLTLGSGDDWWLLPTGTYLIVNVAFYSCVIFLAASLIPRFRGSKDRPKPAS